MTVDATQVEWALASLAARVREAEAERDALRGRLDASQAEHDALCDALVAVSRGEVPGAIDGCVIAADALRAIYGAMSGEGSEGR